MRYFILSTPLAREYVERAGSQFIAQVTRNGDKTGFTGVLELPMATSGSDQLPTVLLDQLDSFSNFHIRSLHLFEHAGHEQSMTHWANVWAVSGARSTSIALRG